MFEVAAKTRGFERAEQKNTYLKIEVLRGVSGERRRGEKRERGEESWLMGVAVEVGAGFGGGPVGSAVFDAFGSD